MVVKNGPDGLGHCSPIFMRDAVAKRDDARRVRDPILQLRLHSQDVVERFCENLEGALDSETEHLVSRVFREGFFANGADQQVACVIDVPQERPDVTRRHKAVAGRAEWTRRCRDS